MFADRNRFRPGLESCEDRTVPSVVTIAAGPNAYEGGAPGSYTLSFWANGKEFKETVSISLNEKSADFGSVPSYLIERAESATCGPSGG